MSNKFPECDDCYFQHREPAICDECEDGDQFEAESADDDALDVLRNIQFKPTGQVIPILAVRRHQSPELELEAA